MRAYFQRVAAPLGPVTVSFAVRFGEAAEQIVEEAEVTRATLIAMATHRRTARRSPPAKGTRPVPSPQQAALLGAPAATGIAGRT